MLTSIEYRIYIKRDFPPTKPFIGLIAMTVIGLRHLFHFIYIILYVYVLVCEYV